MMAESPESLGASPDGDRAVGPAAPSPSVSAVPASIASACGMDDCGEARGWGCKWCDFERPDRLTGKMKRARYMLPLDELPKGSVAVGVVEWRDLPESIEEQDSTSGFLNNEARPVPPDWGGKEKT